MVIKFCELIFRGDVLTLTLNESQLHELFWDEDGEESTLIMDNIAYPLSVTKEKFYLLLDEPVKHYSSEAPTWKQLTFARAIEEKTGIYLTEDDLRSVASCGRYIRKNEGKYKHRKADTKPRCSSTTNMPKNSQKAYVKPQRKSKPPLPNHIPSNKQIGLAEEAAKFRGVDVPAEVYRDRKTCFEFINKHNSFRYEAL